MTFSAPPPPPNKKCLTTIRFIIVAFTLQLLSTLPCLSTATTYSNKYKNNNYYCAIHNRQGRQPRHYHTSSFLFFRPKHQKFTWSASLDRKTGIASSIETSCTPLPSLSIPTTPKSSSSSSNTNNKSSLAYITSTLLSQYVSFLTKPSVTFGLFTTTHIYKKKEEKMMIGTSLQDVLFGISFLNFGNPRMVVNHDDYPPQKEDCAAAASVEIPIIGGLLAIMPSLKNKEVTKNIPTEEEEAMEECGCIRLTIQQQSSSSNTNNDSVLNIQTEIVNEYHPLLVGSTLPIPILRKWVYRLTQSIIHAYVMWRFHDYCVREYCNMMMMQGTQHEL